MYFLLFILPPNSIELLEPAIKSSQLQVKKKNKKKMRFIFLANIHKVYIERACDYLTTVKFNNKRL